MSITPETQENKLKTPLFDFGDIDYLLSHFSYEQLKRELDRAETELHLALYLDDPDAGYREEYFTLVQSALARFKLPKPIIKPGHIDIESLKAKTDIVEVAERYTTLRKSGKRFTGLCPIHSEKTPSFYVFPDEQRWHCFGCNHGGDVIALVMAAEHLDFKAACAVIGGA